MPEHTAKARQAAAGIREAFHAQVIANQYAQVFQGLLKTRHRPAVPPVAVAGHASVSVVIPTYNRRDQLAAVVARYAEVAEGLDYELIVIDDGSTDGTAELLQTLASQLPRLRYECVSNGGPGQARNVGAAMAAKEVVLFVGDDIVPCDDRFVRTHARLHACNRSNDFAVLGKVIWPSDGSIPVSAVMRQIQGQTGEQFGYAHLRPFSHLDWRFFYTCNVSVKRTLVADWRRDGFSSDFTAAAFEDAEFAYRMFQRSGHFQIYYDPASLGTHHHVHTVRTFMDRQFAVGEMAAVLIAKHPKIAATLSLDCLIRVMESEEATAQGSHVSELLSVIEGIKAFAVLLEERGALGDSHWHQAFMGAVFKLVMDQGFIVGRSTGAAATGAGYESILSEFIRRIEPIVDIELPGFRGLLDSFKVRLRSAA
jgi:glycosyltransferase involved in cell wall biosynthesis